MIHAGEEPECPAPPCMDLAEFVEAVKSDTSVVGLGSSWNRASFGGQTDFCSASHLVATDADGTALYCSEVRWTEPRGLAYVDDFMAKLRALADFKNR